jgi:hypothetical protein
MVTGGLFQFYRWLLSLMESVVPARMVLLDFGPFANMDESV